MVKSCLAADALEEEWSSTSLPTLGRFLPLKVVPVGRASFVSTWATISLIELLLCQSERWFGLVRRALRLRKGGRAFPNVKFFH